MKVPFLDLNRSHQPLRAELLAAFAETLDNTRFSLGKDVQDFESAFASACGADEAVALDNGTSALHVAALALGLGPGDEVVVPAFTFISSAWTASYVGAKINFADIDPVTYTITGKTLEAVITPRTRAVVVVHLFGQPAPMTEILEVAAKHGLKVIEDCAQSHLARYRDNPVGLIGDAGTFSFYPTKNLGGCGEGGAIISRHPEVLDTARVLRVHGSSERYLHDRIGFNYRMEGFQAAALNIKLKHLSRWTERRRAIANRYREEIRLSDLVLPVVPEYGESVYHQFTVRHPKRDALREYLTRAEIGTDIIYPIPLHRQPCYAPLGYGEGSFPAAESSARTVLSLPIFPELTDEEIGYIISTINRF